MAYVKSLQQSLQSLCGFISQQNDGQKYIIHCCLVTSGFLGEPKYVLLGENILQYWDGVVGK